MRQIAVRKSRKKQMKQNAVEKQKKQVRQNFGR